MKCLRDSMIRLEARQIAKNHPCAVLIVACRLSVKTALLKIYQYALADPYLRTAEYFESSSMMVGSRGLPCFILFQLQ